MGNKNRLQDLLDMFDITAADMSRETGLPKSSISMWLSGERTMRQDKIQVISDHYHVDPAWLMGYPVPMHRNIDEALAQLKQLSGDKTMELDGTEVQIVESYRKADDFDKISVLRILSLNKIADSIKKNFKPDEDYFLPIPQDGFYDEAESKLAAHPNDNPHAGENDTPEADINKL